LLTIFDWRQQLLGALPSDRLMVLGLLAVALILIAVAARVVKRISWRHGARERQLATLAELGRRAIEAEDLSDLLDWVVSRVGRALNVGIVELLELDGAHGRLQLRAGRGFGSGLVGAEELDLAHSPRVKEALDSGKPVVLQLGRRRSALDPRLSEHGVRSGITVPIPGRALGFGALSAHSHKGRDFRAEEVRFLEAAASLLGIAIEARRTHQEACVNQRGLALLNEASRQLAPCLEPASVLEVLARVALPFLADFLLVDLVGEEGRLQRLVATGGDPQAPLRRVDGESLSSLRVGKGANGRLGVHRARFASDATEELQRIAADPEQLELLQSADLSSVLVVPLEAAGGVLGSLCLGTRDSRSPYGPAELALAGDLARRVAVTLEKTRLYGERAELDPRKGEFLGMLTRELRDSIATLSNTIEVLRLGEAEGLQPRAMEVAARQVGGMNRLVADLLDVSRGTPGTIELHREPLELGALVRRTVESARPALGLRAQAVELVLPETPLWVDGDAVRLEQIVMTLLDSIARSGGREATIEVCVQGEGEAKESAVRIASDSLSPASSPRSSDTAPAPTDSSPEPPGLGVELYLVQCLAELHGGEIRLQNGRDPAKREFVLRLPSMPAPVSGSGRHSPRVEETNGVRVLVVDDHEDLATGLAELLERWGHEARVAFDGPSALEAARGFQPELVLLDLGLPGMDGYAVAETFRQEPSLSDVEVAALTGYAHADDRRRARESGIDHYFTKPIDLAALRRLLESRAGKTHSAPKAGENRRSSRV